MLRTIVEGEPGIFPDPVARVMRRIGGFFDRGRPAAPEPPDEPGTDEPATGEPRTEDTDEVRTGERTSDEASGPADGRHEPGTK